MLNRELFQRLQALSKLRLPPEEEKVLLPQMARILDFVGQLESTGDPRTPPADVPPPPRLRGDDPADALAPEEALAGAASSSGGLFRVPPVLPPEAP